MTSGESDRQPPKSIRLKSGVLDNPLFLSSVRHKGQELTQRESRIFLYLTSEKAGSREFPLPSLSSQKGTLMICISRGKSQNLNEQDAVTGIYA